ncbi:MAG: serine--tRNA ligase [Thermoproteota archaeon]|nr:MAG: serine--tRNA ligase [Candidatus Korarchaeota archaeon]
MWSILDLLRNNPEKLKESQRRRGLPPTLVDEALEYDLAWRKAVTELNNLRKLRNEITREIAKAPSSRRDELIKKAREISEEVKRKENEVKLLEERRMKLLLSIPNVVHDAVPLGSGEEDNRPIRYWGRPKVWKGYLGQFLTQIGEAQVDYELIEWLPKPHADQLKFLGAGDTDRAAKVAGSRFFYLFQDLVWLEYALMLYALDYLSKRGFILVEPPFMMRRKMYEGVTAIQDFTDAIYKVEGEDLYLIATSEHPIAAMHADEVFLESDLPALYAGVSPCFRKEAGAHGKDTKGIFRVHQFLKVEQFVFCLPEDSWKWHEELIKNAEDLWRGLEIPYRIVDVCTGDLGVVAARKYDLEAWMPAQGRYREMVSCSNCTDWQSYRLNIRYREKTGAPVKGFVHTLNSTAIACHRAITAILENHQEEDGTIVVPRALRKYLEIFPKAPVDHIEPAKAVPEPSR